MIEQVEDTAFKESHIEANSSFGSKRIKIGAAIAGAVLLLAIGGIWLLNYLAVDRPLQRVTSENTANHVVKASAHFGSWVSLGTLVFNLTDVSGDASRIDVFRVFLQYAEAMKDKRFDRVILAAKGTDKFQIDGSYFNQLGQEYSTQNPIYTIRTFPAHVEPLDGGSRFSEYDGGIFAVLTAELDQFNQFSDRWYLKDFTSSAGLSSNLDSQGSQTAPHPASSNPEPSTPQPSSSWDTNTEINPVSGEKTTYATATSGEQSMVIRQTGKKLELFVNTGEFLETVSNMDSGLVSITYRMLTLIRSVPFEAR